MASLGVDGIVGCIMRMSERHGENAARRVGVVGAGRMRRGRRSVGPVRRVERGRLTPKYKYQYKSKNKYQH